jgi:hypothetical protein
MKLILVRVGCALALVVLGWVAGRAQAVPEPQFVLELEAPQGWTSVTCSRGCELIGSRDHGNGGRMLQYDYGCGVGGTPSKPELQPSSQSLRCKATVYGWRKD